MIISYENKILNFNVKCIINFLKIATINEIIK